MRPAFSPSSCISKVPVTMCSGGRAGGEGGGGSGGLDGGAGGAIISTMVTDASGTPRDSDRPLRIAGPFMKLLTVSAMDALGVDDEASVMFQKLDIKGPCHQVKQRRSRRRGRGGQGQGRWGQLWRCSWRRYRARAVHRGR
eukprot:scaffold27248_cov133-Isochrysis_galbana.AAC.18